jgi:proliferating cell nuclear antigen
MTSKNYIFKAKTIEAYTIKSLSEVLQNILTDVCFTFDKDGISLLTIDNKKPANLLIHLKMNSESFDEYYCLKPINVGINLQHLYKMLKSIKKKDNIILFINKNNNGLLGITTIQGDTGQQITSHIKIQKLAQVATEIPNNYSHPIHISTNIFQKMCKDMQSISNKINIYSKGVYLKFSCEVEGMYTREVPFGELDEENLGEEYEDIFYTKSLSQLIKVSGLNSKMQIYIPPLNSTVEIPLKLSINTGQIGKLEIYIKSLNQIDGEIQEESIHY